MEVMDTASQRILVIDDEPMVREVVARYLTEAGYEVETLADGDSARHAIRDATPDLVVLDVMLPGRDGLAVLRDLRSEQQRLPVILLTARSDESDRIQGLDIGADDYVAKPFSPRELVARVRSVLRRTSRPEDSQPLEFDGLTIHPARREVHVDGERVELTRKEFDLLHHLASSPRQVFSRAQLLTSVWDSSPDWQDPSTVTVHVRRLRSKIERHPDEPRWITTSWGVGYRFEP
jgi:DNA-binding response OmpR family regulator